MYNKLQQLVNSNKSNSRSRGKSCKKPDGAKKRKNLMESRKKN